MKILLCKTIYLVQIIFLAAIPLFSQEIKIQKAFELVESEGDENYIFWEPASFDIDEEGNIYILDTGNGRIQKFDGQGIYINTIGQKGQGPGELNYPDSIRISGNKIFVSDPVNIRITIYTLEGKIIDSLISGSFFQNIVFDSKGNIYHRDSKVLGPYSYNILSKNDSKGNFKFHIGEKSPWPASATRKGQGVPLLK